MRTETREDGMSGEKLDVWFEDQLGPVDKVRQPNLFCN